METWVMENCLYKLWVIRLNIFKFKWRFNGSIYITLYTSE